MKTINWPKTRAPKRAGPEWFAALGYAEGVRQCVDATEKHVEVYGSIPRATFLIAEWPRTKRVLHYQNADYEAAYDRALEDCQQRFDEAQK